MASPSGLTSKPKSMDAFACMCVRVTNFVRVEKSRCKREQSESCEKENRVYREL